MKLTHHGMIVMLSRKDLEIHLSTMTGFDEPKIQLEQYQTPARVAANLIHRAMMLGDITNKSIVDLCSGTGILGIGAALSGATVTAVEIDPAAISILRDNMYKADVNLNIIQADVLTWIPPNSFDVALLNPPFGIQQKTYRDLNFIVKALSTASFAYVIVDGSPSNIEKLPRLLEKQKIAVDDFYLDEFPIHNSYFWHTVKYKIHKVMVLRLSSML
ncbi:MAG: METTL5 family protein [Candidatus Kariarchaeaceae archaeon]|jgi:putative methylase